MNLTDNRGGNFLIGKRLSALIFLALCFGAGLAAGCILASYLKRDTLGELAVYLNDYFSLLKQGQAPAVSLLGAFWEVFRWPLMVLIFGLTAFGAAAVPLLFGLRGLLLSYSAAVFVQLFGLSGLPIALAVFGVSAVFSVTSLFMTGLNAFEWGRNLAVSPLRKGHEPLLTGQLLVHAAVCVSWLTAGTLIEYWFSPVLLRAAADLVL